MNNDDFPYLCGKLSILSNIHFFFCSYNQFQLYYLRNNYGTTYRRPYLSHFLTNFKFSNKTKNAESFCNPLLHATSCDLLSVFIVIKKLQTEKQKSHFHIIGKKSFIPLSQMQFVEGGAPAHCLNSTKK